MKKGKVNEVKERHDKIMDMHLKGFTTLQIANEVGYKEDSVKQFLYKQGINSVTDRKKKIDIRNEKIHELYKTGLSMRQIGIETDCSSSTVKLVLEDVRFNTVKPKNKLTLAEKKQFPEKVKVEPAVVEVPKVTEKITVIENGRFVEKVKVFLDITELCGKQKVYMERRLV
jgi:orotate phosphoribosyltransferase-like protein